MYEARQIMRTPKRAAYVIAFAVAVGVIQLAAFAIGRATGDLIYLAASVGLVLGTAWLSRCASNRFAAFALGLLASPPLLIFHTFWTGFLRDDFFGLSEDFGQSMVLGFAICWIVMLTLVSSCVSALSFRKHRRPERYWPASAPDA
jgi:hypothetical protein